MIHPRILLRLLPRDLRERYGPEMEALVEERMRRAGPRGVAGVWIWLGLDVLRSRTGGAGFRSERVSREGGGGRMGALLQDFGYAVRRLVRTPVFTVGAILIMAGAIGANTAAFAFADRVLLTPPRYDEPDRVVNIYQDSDDGEPSASSFPAYRDLSALTGTFESVAAFVPWTLRLGEGEDRAAVAVEFATASLFPTLGLRPGRGRWFSDEMDQVGAGLYGVVSHASWVRRFGADPGMVGRVVQLGGQPVTVIGVGPKGFNSTTGVGVTDFWLSISSVGVAGDFWILNLERREDHWYDIRARLAPGVTVEQAREAADALAARLAEAHPELNRGRGINVYASTEIRAHPRLDGPLRSGASLLMGIVAFVLLLAVTNLGSLLLIRGLSRAPEVAVRRALGAGARRVAALFLIEAMVLSGVGGIVGIGLAAWLVRLARGLSLPRPFPAALDLGIDGSVLLFSLVLMLGTGLFFGWAPALASLRSDLSGTLREDGGVAGGGRRLSFLRNGMVATQVGVSLVLVVGASLMLRSLGALRQVDVGADTGRVAVMSMDLEEAGIDADRRGLLLDELQGRLEAVPGVTGVAVASRLPLSAGGSTTTVVEGYEPEAGTGSVELAWTQIGPGYFETLGVPVLAGRPYEPADVGGDERVVMVNETAALRFWGGAGEAVGRRTRPQGAPDGWFRVIGVTGDVRVARLDEPPTPMLYFLAGRDGPSNPWVLVRTEGEPESLATAMRAALAEVDPDLGVAVLSTLDAHVGEALSTPRLAAGTLALFSALALLLAGIGIYTLASLSVASRRAEIGLRMALGAGRVQVTRMVLWRVAVTVGIGLSLGAGALALLSGRLEGLLFGVTLTDPLALLAAVGVLGGSVFLASWIPARRASRLDPVESLRRE